jgi:hypothetical protein
MLRVISFCSSLPLPNISLQEPFSIQLLRWHQLQTAAHLQLGMDRDANARTLLIVRSYHNGSILIATLQPSFTILHTLTTPRVPTPVAGLAWHGSSSKQKSEMLAAQASDGDLRVWSVPKTSHGGDAPCVIRVLNKSDQRELGPCWFSWSKNGRIIQYTEGYVPIDILVTLDVYADSRCVTAKHVRGMFAPRESHMRLFLQPKMLQLSAAMVQLLPCSPWAATIVYSNTTSTLVACQ